MKLVFKCYIKHKIDHNISMCPRIYNTALFGLYLNWCIQMQTLDHQCFRVCFHFLPLSDHLYKTKIVDPLDIRNIILKGPMTSPWCECDQPSHTVLKNLSLMTSQVGVSTQMCAGQISQPGYPVDCSRRCSSIRYTSRWTRPLVMS